MGAREEPARPLEGLRVAIAGGAIGGAAAALLLAARGAQVTLLERVEQPRAVGAGILLQPNGLAVLYGLGLESALRRYGTCVNQIAVIDAARRPVLGGAVPDYGAGLDHAMGIHRSRLLAALLAAVAAEPGINARFGASVTGATAAGEVTYSQHGATHHLLADLVVGADGVHSRIRDAGAFGAEARHTGVTYVRGMSGYRVETSDCYEAWTRLGLFGVCPVEDQTYFFTSAQAPTLAAALAARDLEAFRRLWADAFPPSRPILREIESFDQLLLNEVVQVHCRSYVDGRSALLGDAAHAMYPNLGQGANSALVDGAVLAAELAATPGDLSAALARYDARRRPGARAVQDGAARLASLVHLHPPVLHPVRNATVRGLSRVIGRAGTERQLRKYQQEDPTWLLSSARRAPATITA